MTISINAHRGSNHKGKLMAQKERWVPENDDGGRFTPAAWVADGEPFEVPAGSGHAQGLDDGQSIKFWAVAEEV